MTGQPWTVHTSWRAHRSLPACDTVDTCLDWLSARRLALQLACCAGSRYVTVLDPACVVVGEWDWYTNRWREFGLRVGG